MGIRVRPLHPHLGAEITGDRSRGAARPRGVRRHRGRLQPARACWCFPASRSATSSRSPSRGNFGPLETSPEYAGSKKARLARPEIADISNLDPESRVMSAEDKRLIFNRGNQLWHTDSSFKFVAGALLAAFARARSRRAAARPNSPISAPPMTRCRRKRSARIDGLVVEHSIFRSRAQIGFTEFNDEITPRAAARAAAPGAPPSRLRPQDALSRLPCLACHRLAAGGGPRADRAAHRLCHRAALRLPAIAGRSAIS